MNTPQTGNSPRPHRRISEEYSYNEHKVINQAHHIPNRPHKKISPWKKEKSLATPNCHRRYWRYQPLPGRITSGKERTVHKDGTRSKNTTPRTKQLGLRKHRPRNGKTIRHRLATADDGNNQRPQTIKNTCLLGTPAIRQHSG